MAPALSVAGTGALGRFARHQWHHPAPLMRLHALREKTFQMGLALYVLYYYESTGFSYLISRFLESGLGYPVENAGRLVDVTSLISASTLSVYLRHAKLLPRKKWLIVSGFAVAALATFSMTRMTPDASEATLVVPLLLRGLLLFIVLPIANLTFRIFAIDEFTHGYRLKNIVRQLTISFATPSVIVVERHRDALHRTRLVEVATPFNPLFRDALAALTQCFEAAGRTTDEAHALAMAEMSGLVALQASFLTSLDGFYFLIGVAVCSALFAAWQQQID
ncbi:hypothetical protein JCM10599A_25500 [Paraburkholderia kururiensis]